jgi:hypothetical protein
MPSRGVRLQSADSVLHSPSATQAHIFGRGSDLVNNGMWATNDPENASRIALRALLVYAVSVLLFWATMRSWLGTSLLLPTGSISVPPPLFMSVWSSYGLWGTAMSAAATIYLLYKTPDVDIGRFYSQNHRPILAVFATLAFAAALFCRLAVLKQAPLTDDESAYVLAAKTLLTGNLWLDSPSEPEFFSRAFLVNDGRMFTQYFLGWPAVLAPSVRANLSGLLNPLLFGLSVFPLARILERHVDGAITLGALVAFSTSLLLIGSAATLLPYTSSLLLLICFMERCGRNSDEISPAGAALTALIGSAAFFIRPSSAMLVCTPFAALMLRNLLAHGGKPGRNSVCAFLITGAVFATAFLSINARLYGGPLETGYSRMLEFELATGLQFAWENFAMREGMSHSLNNPTTAISNLGILIARVTFDHLGSLLLLGLIALFGWCKASAANLVSITGVLLTHALLADGGIDTFGPVHLIEMTGSLTIVSAIAVSRAATWARNHTQTMNRALIEKACLALFLGISISNWTTYFPLRLSSVSAAAQNVSSTLQAADSLPGSSLVFAAHPFINQRPISPMRHFVFHIPAGHPQFNEKTLWSNDLGPARNLELARHHPDRTPYALRWSEIGSPIFIPLDTLQAN